LARIDKLILDPNGNFKVLQGNPAIVPQAPPDPASGMVLAILTYGPYTLSTKDVKIKLIPNKVYTMRDIAKIDNRVSNLETLMALNLLEQNTKDFMIPDSVTGLDRYKSGFVVDPFKNNDVADYKNSDCRYAIDPKNQILRPSYNTNAVDMSFVAAQSENVEYQSKKTTNKILTLPYTEVSLVVQDKASRFCNLNPYNITLFSGFLQLDPATDTWKETKYLPDVHTVDNSNYDAVLSNLRLQNVLGTVWNEWTTDWVGESVTIVDEVQITNSYIEAERKFRQTGERTPQGVELFETITATTVTQHQSRTGTETVVTNVPKETVNDRIVNTAMIPYCRKKQINFSATGLKPLTKVYAFFDDVNVTAYCTPSELTTDANGKVSGVFNLPDPTVEGAPAFRTGTRVFKLTDSATNSPTYVTTFATAKYTASGTLESSQRTIQALELLRFNASL
jgi:hypothetical protein